MESPNSYAGFQVSNHCQSGACYIYLGVADIFVVTIVLFFLKNKYYGKSLRFLRTL